MLFLIAAPAQAKYGGGTGEPNDPYLIFTAEQMNEIGLSGNWDDWDKCFKLMADIDLSAFTGTSFNIIGSWGNPFTGVFDGSDHTISNFSYTSIGTSHVALFAHVSGENAEIKDLGLLDPNVDSGRRDYAGSLVSQLSGGATITNCYAEGGSVAGYRYIGGLVGFNRGTISNCYASGDVSGDSLVGGLVGSNRNGTITNCYATDSVSSSGSAGGLVGDNGGTITNCYSSGGVSGNWFVGGLVGFNRGTISNCYSSGSISGAAYVGGVVGEHNTGTVSHCYFEGIVSGTGSYSGGIAGINRSRATISYCYSSGSVYGFGQVGGLAGGNFSGLSSDGIVANCYSTSSVDGDRTVGGLVGLNKAQVLNSYSTGNVLGVESVGGLIGKNGYSTSGYGEISNCYSAGGVSGTTNVGGLVGLNDSGTVSASFWDTETSGQSTSDGGMGLPTTEMQTMSTFTDAGWDFNTPVWIIDEGVDYPRLWWETVPVLHAEPEVTLGTTNVISWEPIPGANDYYAECAEDANFTSIVCATGWITETTCEFTGLELGRRYWYSVKARNIAGTETNWSNVESSLQATLTDAVAVMLDPDTLKNKNMKNALLNKINAVQQMLDAGRYEEALNKLQNDILQKTDGCVDTGQPDKNDWIITCEEQGELYPLVIETIENVKGLMNQ